jgi:hypothetical protein
MLTMPAFFSGSFVCNVVEHENVLQAELIGNRVSMSFVMKKHWDHDHYQVVHDCGQRSEAVSSLENKR